MKLFTLFFGLWLVLISSTTFAQANVRGWYADGQVWILWDLDNSPPETHGIYSSAPSFTNINQAQLTGRSSHTDDNSPDAKSHRRSRDSQAAAIQVASRQAITMVGFQLPVKGHVTLKVFDARGRKWRDWWMVKWRQENTP